MLKVSSTLRGSTLVEVIVAMVIILLITTSVSTYIVNSNAGSNSFQLTKAMIILDNEFNQLSKIQMMIESTSTETISNFTVLKNISRYPNSSNLYILSITVSDTNGKPILTRKRIVTANK